MSSRSTGRYFINVPLKSAERAERADRACADRTREEEEVGLVNELKSLG